MSDSTHMIIGRRQRLAKAISKLEKRLSDYKKEYDDICITLEVMHRFGIATTNSGDGIIPKTIGDMAVKILEEHSDGLTTNQILKIIHDKWMPDLKRSSLSPPLSRLKGSGDIDLQDDVWRLPIKATDADFIDITSSDFLEEDIPF